MGLIKKRPRISLIAPREIRAGGDFVVQVVLSCEAPVPVDELQVSFEGTSGFYTHSQYGEHRNEARFLRAVASIETPSELSQGEHAYKIKFNLPTDAPSTFRADLVFVEYRVHVRADIPWWPDARATFVLRVVGAESVGNPGSHVYVTDGEGPPGRKPYFELSLANGGVKPGGVLEGVISLANVAHNDYRNITVRLLAEQTASHVFGPTITRAPRARWMVTPSQLAEGAPIRFRLQMPADMPPAFRHGNVGLRWLLEVRADVAWGVDPKILIPVYVRTPDPLRETWDAPLAVGSERLTLIWKNVAEQVGATLEGDRMTAEVGDASVDLRREHRGRRGLGLVGELRFPNLGVGLSVDDGTWSARDPGHARSFASVLASLGDAGLAEADDEHVLWRVDDAGLRSESLKRLVESMMHTARAIQHVHGRLGPPEGAEDLARAWEGAADHLHARFVPAALALKGARQHARFRIAPEWGADGEVARWSAEVRPLQPIRESAHLQWEAGTEHPTVDGIDLAPLLRDAGVLTVSRDVIRCSFRADWQPETAVGHVDHLLALERALAGAASPYR